MRLYGSPTSPYTRKVRVLALELGLHLDLEWVNPLEDPPSLLAHTPLGRVPVLVTEEGPFFDSRVIADVLCAYTGAAPETPRERCLEALAEGVMDEALAMRMAEVRGQGNAPWLERGWSKIKRALASLESQLPTGFDRPAIGIACALAYVDFRLGARPWRDECPLLADWLKEASGRPSMKATEYGVR